jgi:hypothetical protein
MMIEKEPSKETIQRGDMLFLNHPGADDIFSGYGLTLHPGRKDVLVGLLMVERNNHGHTVLLALEYAGYENIYISPLDKKAGWLSNRRDKVLAVDNAAQALRQGCCTVNYEGTLAELADLEAGTLKAPAGTHDDLAMAFINGLAGLRWQSFEEKRGEGVSIVIRRRDILDDLKF